MRRLVLPLLLAASVSLALVATPVVADGTATAAKKCKKKRAAAAKKKCKKKGGGGSALPPPVPVLPIVPKPPAPTGPEPTGVTAATLTWDTHSASKADLDLHVWDSDGNHAGTEPGMTPPQVANEISGGDHQGDTGLQSSGLAANEQFTDFNADEHEVTIGVCYGNADPGTPPTADWELEVNRSDGSSQTYTPNNPFTTLGQTFKLSDGEPTSYVPTSICDGE